MYTCSLVGQGSPSFCGGIYLVLGYVAARSVVCCLCREALDFQNPTTTEVPRGLCTTRIALLRAFLSAMKFEICWQGVFDETAVLL